MSRESEVDKTIASGQASIERSKQRREGEIRERTERIKKRRTAHWLHKLKRMASTVVVILAGAGLFGLFFRPLGFAGVVITFGLIVASLAYFARKPAYVEPQVEDLTNTDIAQLARRTELWLEAQYVALPSTAQYSLDDIDEKLALLSPQLQDLDPNSTAAGAIRRLLAEDLTALVNGYRSIPMNLRRKHHVGQTPDQQLCDGLALIANEIDSVTSKLAQGKLDDLATRSRFLELKYPGQDSN